MTEAMVVKVKILIRTGLIFWVVYVISWNFFPPPFAGTGREKTLEIMNGMGGGMLYPEHSLAGVEVDTGSPEMEGISGIPEPDEYSKPRMLLYNSYTVQRGDTIGDIARNLGLNQDTLISLNNIKNTRLLQIGQVLRVPNQDGILYPVQKGDTLVSVAEKYKADVQAIQTANELFPGVLKTNASLFIPGARLEWVNLQEINGDLFIWPVSGYITSPYGYRNSPFTGARQFHTGLDIGAAMGTTIKAAMSGRVTTVGYNDSFGNYVVITHHSGYRTLYGHMSLVRVKSGAYVQTGERIGDVGSTGLSTGPHLHFTVYKNGVTVNPRLLIK
ncbi:MAG: M23 family metallopeptidase [Treponema sp.]|nr:M23 family metallopeptidase [Treponema sp.]